jgi:hypothetical protein
MKKVLFTLCLIVSIQQAFASFPDSLPTKNIRARNLLGFNVGAVSGLGLSYRFAPEGKMMHQFTFLPIATSDFYFVDAAYTMFYRIREKRYTDFNSYFGTHFILVDSGVLNVTGCGLGFDFQLSDFSFNINGGYGIYSGGGSGIGLFPTGELGLFYKL